MQDYSNSIALAMELLQSCTKPSISDHHVGSSNNFFQDISCFVIIITPVMPS